MAFVLIVSILTILTMLLMIIKKPSFKIYKFTFESFWVVSLIGALVLIIFNKISINEISFAFKTGKVNPFEILVLFISVTLISIVLDELGFFSYAANATIKVFNKNQKALFFGLYFIVSFLTIFTSNDIIILTFTPFICFFCKRANINPIPYLVSEFVAANTWSMLFIIGNPTNIFLGTTYDISFFEYFKVMALPTLFGGLSSLALLFLLFRKTLNQELKVECTESRIYNKTLLIISLCHLGLCTVLLAISHIINIEMWLICLFFGISISLCLIGFGIIRKTNTIFVRSYKRAPWSLVPFVISMFIIILSLDKYGVTNDIGEFLLKISKGAKIKEALLYGVTSSLADNVVNNIPMCLAASKVLSINPSNIAIYATIIGSNVGAFLTPIGALAGIMWMNMLKKYEVKYSFLDFTKYGLLIVPIVLFFSSLGLLIVL